MKNYIIRKLIRPRVVELCLLWGDSHDRFGSSVHRIIVSTTYVHISLMHMYIGKELDVWIHRINFWNKIKKPKLLKTTIVKWHCNDLLINIIIKQ